MKMLTRDELNQLIKQQGKEQAFLTVAAHRDFNHVKQMIESYGKSIVQTFGAVPMELHPNYAHLRTLAEGFVLKGSALDMAITGNTFPVHVNQVNTNLVALVQLLMTYGCPLHSKDKETRPLHRILEDALQLDEGAKLQIVEILLKAGANPYAFKELTHQLPLDATTSVSLKINVKKLYKKYGIHYDTMNVTQAKQKQKQKIALLEAIIEKNEEAVKKILQTSIIEPGDAIQYRGEEHSFVALSLMFAPNEITLALLKARAARQDYYKDNLAKEAKLLALSAQSSMKEVCLEMIKQGLDLNQILEPDPNNGFYFNLPLRLWHYFCIKGDRELVKCLLERFDTLALDTPTPYNILSLLQPKADPAIQTLYKDGLKQLKSSLKSSQLEFLFSLQEKFQRALMLEEQGEENAINASIKEISKTLSKQERYILQDRIKDYVAHSKVGWLKETSFVKSFIKEMTPLLPLKKLHQAFESLFLGGDEKHHEIYDMLRKAKPQYVDNAPMVTTQQAIVSGGPLATWSEKLMVSIKKNPLPFNFFCCHRRKFVSTDNVSEKSQTIPDIVDMYAAQAKR